MSGWEDFQRDQNPEKEVIIWEAIAAAYLIFTKDRSLNASAKREAFHLLLLRTMVQERAALGKAALRHLSRAEAKGLLVLFKDMASAKGSWID